MTSIIFLQSLDFQYIRHITFQSKKLKGLMMFTHCLLGNTFKYINVKNQREDDETYKSLQKNTQETKDCASRAKQKLKCGIRCHTKVLSKIVKNDHGYVPFVVNTSRSFPYSYKTKDRVTRTQPKTNNDLQNIHIKLKIE
jgi:hypothetical protein